MADITNLTHARKVHARAEARQKADENAARHGQTKAARLLKAAQSEKARRMLDQHRLEDQDELDDQDENGPV